MKLELYASHYSHLAVRSSKKSRNQETGFGNSGRLKVLTDTNLIPNDLKPGVTHAHLRPIWHHSEPSDIHIHSWFLGWNFLSLSDFGGTIFFHVYALYKGRGRCLICHYKTFLLYSCILTCRSFGRCVKFVYQQ